LSKGKAVTQKPMHTFSLVTRDRPGVLVRIALVFSRRGYNIASLAVSPGANEGFARMTIVSHGDPENIDQILKQLAKLVDVVFVTDHRGETPLEAEIALIKLRAGGDLRKRSVALAERRGAKIADDTDGRVILSAVGTSVEIDSLLAELASEALEEVVRSGKIVIDPGASHFAHLLMRQAGE
jgi:acetolactate synthase I/III small subunit